jgi:hypothetical protein
MKTLVQRPEFCCNSRHITGKIAVGLMLVAGTLALAKLLDVWGRDYWGRAQDDFFDSLWLNEQRRTA